MEFKHKIEAIAKDGVVCGEIIFLHGEYMFKITDNRYCISQATTKQITKKLKELNANV